MTDRPTWLIVGLGNPGTRYAQTRHNIGFMVVDRLLRDLPAGTHRRRFDAEIAETAADGRRIVLVKPQTFMNRSGNAVQQVIRWYHVPLDRVLVIYDDLDLPFGQLRLRPDGSSGGHNGLESIIAQLGTTGFPRLRIGITRQTRGDTVNYVLSRFSREEEARLPEIIQEAAEAALIWSSEGLGPAMNRFNRRSPERVRNAAARPAPGSAGTAGVERDTDS